MLSDRRTASNNNTGGGYSGAERACAFAVHILTASGAGLALLALLAAMHGRWAWMFLTLGVALIVDALDGSLARRVHVADKLPQWSGASIDFVVDFATYVFVPAYAITAGGLLPQPAAIPLGILIVMTGALYFGDRRMKTSDNYFRGFPVLWNIAAFYLFLIRPQAWIAAAAIGLFVVLTFAPFHFIHPIRIRRWRIVNISLLLLWSALAAAAVARDMNPPVWLTLGLCAIGIYFLAVGLLRSIGSEATSDA